MSTEHVESLRKLTAEVGGLKAFEPGVREAIGNTNWTVLMQRLDEAEAALSRTAQAPVADEVEAGARLIAKWLGYSWDGLHDGSVVAKGFPVFTHGQFGWKFQGHKDDVRDLVRDILALASSPAQVEARSDDLAVERAAKAAYENWIEPVRDLEPSWDSLPDSHRERLMDSQRAALRTQVEAKDAPAAPDLLEALSRLVEVCEKQPRISKAYPEPNSPLGMARAAIAKATGRTLAGGSDA